MTKKKRRRNDRERVRCLGNLQKTWNKRQGLQGKLEWGRNLGYEVEGKSAGWSICKS